ncbi:Oxysterol-binding protein [Trinorchestia longiramus]|nr:Oxysterol-binding protein [Trinorchestia longiramus]
MTSANTDGEERAHRTRLPAPQFPSAGDFSLWSVLKQGIGKELSKITMPVVFNEPLSFLQRVTEYLEYANLMNKAIYEDDPVNRMQYVMAFAVSGLASNWERLGKPFNPLLGETFELQHPDYRWVMLWWSCCAAAKVRCLERDEAAAADICSLSHCSLITERKNLHAAVHAHSPVLSVTLFCINYCHF